jgi:hypothetical protein
MESGCYCAYLVVNSFEYVLVGELMKSTVAVRNIVLI